MKSSRTAVPAETLRAQRIHERGASDAWPSVHREVRSGMSALADPQELVDAFARTLNAKDAHALGNLFSEDAEFVNILGMRMQRREGIVDGHAWAFAGPLRGRSVRFDQVDELEVTDDVTVLHGHCIRERQPDAPLEGLPDGTSVLVFVTRRGPKGWQIVAATNVTEAAPPTR
jgi:uncharacterized protein (TIGR02246 family)